MSRGITQYFENYQKARLTFVQAVSDLALRPQNVDLLEKAGAIELLKPLLNDAWSQVRQCATVALGRLVQNSVSISRRILNENFVPILLKDMNLQNKNTKRASLFVIRSICKHNAEMAEYIVKQYGLEEFIQCLNDFESQVKEAAAWVIGYLSRYSAKLAQECVDAGCVPLLVLCLQEPELPIKQIAASAMADIAKHNPTLAQNLIDSGALPHLTKNLLINDDKLKRQILCALCACAKHSEDMAEVVVETQAFPTVLILMAHPCTQVRKNAAALVRDTVKHSLELTQLVVNSGGIAALMEVLSEPDQEAKIPAVTALGYISANSSQVALSVIGCDVVTKLAQILCDGGTVDYLLAATAWALGQIGKHSAEHSNAIAAANVFSRLNELYDSPKSSQELQNKCRNALKSCLQKCILTKCLEPLLYEAKPAILKFVLGQYSKILPNDSKARRLFVSSGCLKKVQDINAQPGSILQEYKNIINHCFPEEIVRYYSPGYPEFILQKVEEYSPQFHVEKSLVDHDNSSGVVYSYDDDDKMSNSSEDL